MVRPVNLTSLDIEKDVLKMEDNFVEEQNFEHTYIFEKSPLLVSNNIPQPISDVFGEMRKALCYVPT